MTHIYEVVLRERDPQSAAPLEGKDATLSVTSHDDILAIMDKIAAKGLFDENEGKVFTLGLKMFSGVMLAHRTDPLFADLAPHFAAFMKKLKS